MEAFTPCFGGAEATVVPPAVEGDAAWSAVEMSVVGTCSSCTARRSEGATKGPLGSPFRWTAGSPVFESTQIRAPWASLPTVIGTSACQLRLAAAAHDVL